MPVLSDGNSKDAAAVEVLHYQWVNDRLTTELNELETEHKELSRTAAERLTRLDELERELDRLNVQQTLGDELSRGYSEEIYEHKERINAEFLSQQDRFIAAKTTALEMLPAVMPMLTAFAQNLRKTDISAPQYPPPHCTIPPAPQRPIAEQPSHNFSHHVSHNHYDTTQEAEYAETIS